MATNGDDKCQSDVENSTPNEMTKLETSVNELNNSKEEVGINGQKENQENEVVINNRTEVHWGFTLPELYRMAVKFYKEKEGKAVHLGYADKCDFVALTIQVTHGPYDAATSPPVGVFDVVGKDRRLAWQQLSNLSKEEAMQSFVDRLTSLTPSFRPYAEAIWMDKLERERLQTEECERQKLEEEETRIKKEQAEKEQQETILQEQTKRQIQEALNSQTYDQFRSYAELQYPGNPDQQAVLIRQLQEQHYHQYMQQVYQQQLQQQQQGINGQGHEGHDEVVKESTEKIKELSNDPRPSGPIGIEQVYYTDSEEDDDGPPIAPASMWTRKDVKSFKDTIRQEGGESIIKVGHGETVTVRVPTHADGTHLFWEFATDSYDIGFGVHFEWTEEVGDTGVSVHISESEEDEEEADNDDDIEKAAAISLQDPARQPQSVIIPVYRRDCHEEVYAGSHTYPGSGVYLLKFDNSYSLWRSKTLYYRVYYTR